MRILWVATKAPSPITDGGRAVMSATIDALAASGACVVTVVTPLPAESDRAGDGNATIVRFVQENVRFIQQRSYFLDWPNSIVRSLKSGRPVSIERHSHAALAARVAALMRDDPPFDVVHAEQLQALPIAEPARRAGVACVLRAQNVESAVWDAAANEAPAWRGAAMRFEAGRLRRFEAAAIASVDATITLSADDAAALAAFAAPAAPSPAAASRITTIAPLVPPRWFDDVDRLHSNPDAGAPAASPRFVWIGSAGWTPNDAARDWLLDDIWPAISARLPEASLHVFGAPASAARARAREGIIWREAPRESAEAFTFTSGAILLIPMRTAAGVRMRLLEAWARGVPVIASPAGVAGLDTEDGRDVLIAADARAFANAAARLSTEPSLRARLVHEGRATLARRHDPGKLAQATLDVYRQAMTHNRTHRQQSHEKQ
jgi:polysaccharide biosynthesis protein PslH